LHRRGEDLFHQPAAARAGGGSLLLVAAAVGPDGVGDAAIGGQPFVIALLVAVVDAGAGKEAVAVVLVGADVADPGTGAERGAVTAHQVDVGHVPRAGGVVARVVEGDVDLSGDRVGREPVVEAIDAAQ